MTVRGVELGAGGPEAEVRAAQENILTQTFIQVGSRILQYIDPTSKPESCRNF